MNSPLQGSPTPLVFDDGGFPAFRRGDTNIPISLDSYRRLLELAARCEVRIPIAVTAAYIDVDNRCELGMAMADSERLIELLQRNQDLLPTWNHGLDHSFRGHAREFAVVGAAGVVPEDIQHAHFEQSQEIFASVGLGRPEVFVPPLHAWQWGVTDRIAKQYGIKAIAIRQFEKRPLRQWIRRPHSPYVMTWEPSQHLKTLYRLGVGIPADRPGLGYLSYLKSRQYVRPLNRIMHYLVHRRFHDMAHPHHFFAHIQNLSIVRSLSRWEGLIRLIREVL